jgi:hypothetical protein
MVSNKTDKSVVLAAENYERANGRVVTLNKMRRPYRTLARTARELSRNGSISSETAVACLNIARAGVETPTSDAAVNGVGWEQTDVISDVQQLVALGLASSCDIRDMRAAVIQQALPERLPKDLWSTGWPWSVESVLKRVMHRIADRAEKRNREAVCEATKLRTKVASLEAAVAAVALTARDKSA